jgi:predicted transcriptional regulator
MQKSTPRNIRFDEDILEAVQRLCDAEERSFPWMINRCMRDWLQAKGHLPKPE